jgi:hypothetical protein
MENIEISNAMFGTSHPRDTTEILTKFLVESVVGIANKYHIVRPHSGSGTSTTKSRLMQRKLRDQAEQLL